MAVDHSTLNRWVIKYAPEFEKQFRRQQRPVGKSWRMDETYVRVKGQWKYLYRAVDKEGQTVDFLLTPHRDREPPKPSCSRLFGPRVPREDHDRSEWQQHGGDHAL